MYFPETWKQDRQPGSQDRRIGQLGHRRSVFKYEESTKITNFGLFSENGVWGFGLDVAFCFCSLIAGKLLWKIGNWWSGGGEAFFVIGVVLSIIFAAIAIAYPITGYKKMNESNEENRARAESEQQAEVTRLNRENCEKKRLTAERAAVYKEYQKALELLDDAYSANIIPSQFRSLYAVYFLYDFITTSKESFSGALLHCDLDKIESQLGRVIAQNEQMIINQQIQIAQDKELLDGNKESLDRLEGLARIENNTLLASQYADIAASNAQACAWIGMANYIKG